MGDKNPKKKMKQAKPAPKPEVAAPISSVKGGAKTKEAGKPERK
ncbi:hypothetical protein LCGC14_1443430 [marine sediment metagenome]|uniref:Uncharacterized protein n=1 Tax=marine sediment metagenome TaxID=412755 RepID=A0A0F9M0E1_9ZZZZ